MKKYLSLTAVVIAVGILVTLLYQSAGNTQTTNTTEKIKLVASFYPLAEFARQVGNGDVEVTNIVSGGSEPHEFEPTSQYVAMIHSSNVFIFNGSGFDPWAEKIQSELEQKGITTVNMSKNMELIEGITEHETDPHFWLDPVLAQKEVEIILDTLMKIDPSNGNNYTESAANYLQKLSELDKKYKDGLVSCAKRDVVTSHAAFGYLAKRYNFNQIAISGLSPDEEPSPKRMGEIVQLAKEKNVTYIFFEALVNPKLAETIANEIGAQTLVFNPLEGLTEEEILQRKDYISVMKDNLKNLRIALSCK